MSSHSCSGLGLTVTHNFECLSAYMAAFGGFAVAIPTIFTAAAFTSKYIRANYGNNLANIDRWIYGTSLITLSAFFFAFGWARMFNVIWYILVLIVTIILIPIIFSRADYLFGSDFQEGRRGTIIFGIVALTSGSLSLMISALISASIAFHEGCLPTV